MDVDKSIGFELIEFRDCYEVYSVVQFGNNQMMAWATPEMYLETKFVDKHLSLRKAIDKANFIALEHVTKLYTRELQQKSDLAIAKVKYLAKKYGIKCYDTPLIESKKDDNLQL